MLDLYKNIKTKRIENGWSQTELAQRVGYSDKSMIAKIENGKIDLTQTKIRTFAKVFGCSESDLMGWDDVPEEVPQYNPLIQDFIDVLPKLTDEQINSLLNMARLFVVQNDAK